MESTNQSYFLCRVVGTDEWHKIDADRADSAEAAIEMYLTAIDKPITRFIDRIVEVRISDSADVLRYAVLLDWNIGYEIKQLPA